MLDLISPKTAVSLDGLFYERCQRTPEQVAYCQFDSETKQWLSYRWQQMAERVSDWQCAIKKENFQPDDRVALLVKNSSEWVVFDQASLGLGLVTVPLYLDDRPDNILYILNDANIRLLLIQEARHWFALKKAMIEAKDDIQSLQRIILLCAKEELTEKNSGTELSDERLLQIDDWLLKQEGILHKREADPHNLATIVYTSGTTGRPKGVMLSHYNILSVCYNTAYQLAIRKDDTLLSFLPLSHTLERSTGYYLPIMAGCRVNYAQSIQQLAGDLLYHKPTIIVAVPRIFEQVYLKIKSQLKTAPLLKRLLFQLTLHTGWQRFLYQQNKRGWPLSNLLWPLLKKLVADKVLDKLGGNMRLAASGGAPISFEVAKMFLSLGLNLLQGYGLTETSPVVSFNRIENNDPRSIGLPVEGVQVRLGDNNELLIKSPGVMMGYWNNHSATNQVKAPEGWLHSGDQASIDKKSGQIYITGRIKDILVMSNGEKVPPADIENTLNMDEWFEQTLIIGENQAFLSAIIVMNAPIWVEVVKSAGLDPFDKENLSNKKIHALVIKHIKTLLHDFPGYAKIRRVILSLDNWTIENNLLTPTMKVKRNKVIEHFQKQIDGVYG